MKDLPNSSEGPLCLNDLDDSSKTNGDIWLTDVQLAFYELSLTFSCYSCLFSCPFRSLLLFRPHTLGLCSASVMSLKGASQVYLSNADSAFFWSRDPHSHGKSDAVT